MDQYKATQLAVLLNGKAIRGYQIVRLLNNGKSAAVFLAEQTGGQQVALKIFDNELIERFGQEIQVQRIQQEIALKGHCIPNLIGILDGGQEIISETSYFFIVMEFIKGQNLKEYILTTDYPSAFVKQIAATLFNTTEKLLEAGIVHRDIKPENIMIGTNGDPTLMDLGVMRLIDEPSSSDIDKKQFLGTLIYAPPEYLTRRESGTIEGWRAINYYQIGAVMHDLIMKREMFDGIAPYANIVIAVKEDAPEISSSAYPFETIQLARDLLSKDPKIRLRLTPASRIINWVNQTEKPPDDLANQMEELFQLGSAPKAKLQEIEHIARSTQEKLEIRRNISKRLEDLVTDAFFRLQEMGGPEWTAYKSFNFGNDYHLQQEWEVRNLLITLNGTLEAGYAQPVRVLVRFQNNERSEATIDLVGLILTETFRKTDLTTPLDIFRQVTSENPRPGGIANVRHNHNAPVNFNGPYHQLVSGTVGIDKQLEDRLLSAIIKIITKAVILMKKDVDFQLAQQEKRALGQSGAYTRTLNSKSILIHELD